MYTLFKIIHMSCAILSIVGFIARGALKLKGSPVVEKKLVKVLPHVVDTVLLASAVVLVVMSGQYPFTTPWVTAKLFALVLYIALGVVVMRTARTQQTRTIAYVLAILTALYILMVAGSKQPWF